MMHAESSLLFILRSYTVPAYWGGERYTRYNVSWRDERTSAINPDLKIKALYLANIIVGWRSADEKWDASLFVKNITDDVDLSHIQAYYSDYHLWWRKFSHLSFMQLILIWEDR